MPTYDIFNAAVGEFQVCAFRELNRHKGRNIGDSERLASDEWIVGELSVEQREESSQGLLCAIDQSRDLGNAPGHAGQDPPLTPSRSVAKDPVDAGANTSRMPRTLR